MALFNRGGKNVVLSERDRMIQKHNVCRSNLLLLIAFTVINIVLIATNSGITFLFSASVPYMIAYLGALFGGEAFLTAPVFYIMLAIALIILGVYFLCWLFSKKHIAWLIVALALFIVDTVCLLALFLLFGDMMSGWMDIFFHAWALYYLISGVVAYFKLKRIPEYEEVTEEGSANAFIDNADTDPQ